METVRSFRIKRSEPDPRDHVFKQSHPLIMKEVDLRVWDSSVEDQGSLGSCASHAMTSAYEIMVNIGYPEKFVDLSRLYVYYHTRYLEGSFLVDQGVLYLRNLMKAVNKYGVCSEILWPYLVENVTSQPTPDCYADGLKRTITEYKRLETSTDVLESLTMSKPVIIGLDIYDGFMDVSKENPVVTDPTGQTIVGGHAMVIVGYSVDSKWYIAKNSFGVQWGDQGYCYLPFDYADTHGFEMWNFQISKQTYSSTVRW